MAENSIPGTLHRPSRAKPVSARRWDWFLTDNLKWLIVTLAIPLVGGWITNQLGEQAAKRADADRAATNARAAADRKAADDRIRQDTRQRAYTDLINKREEAEMGVRSQIFSTLLRDYLDPSKANLPRRLTVLELLASNFDESLNLSPLFWQIDREIATQPAGVRDPLRAQLGNMAKAVKARQVDVLAASGSKHDMTVAFDDLRNSTFSETLHFADPAAPRGSAERGCLFTISVLEHDPARHRFFTLVTSDVVAGAATAASSCLDTSGTQPGPQRWSFWVDEFDFPLIAYTRLSTNERFSVVLMDYDASQRYATFSLVFFPSSRGGARDRPFVDTVIQALNEPTVEPPAVKPLEEKAK